MKLVNKEMAVTSLPVPKGVRYLSDWNEFDLFDFPYILDKRMPGCGFTEWCIRDFFRNIVLCSPRKILLQNKYEQHPDDVFLVINDLKEIRSDDDDVDGDIRVDKDLTKATTISKSTKKKKTKEDIEKENQLIRDKINKLENDLINYVLRCNILNKPVKILVTYDSFRLVKGILTKNEKRLGIFNQLYNVVVDEFQSIFIDSSFKSNTELEFVNQLRDLQKVCFVSATPMMKEYMGYLDDFNTLPYYELDWETEDPLRVVKPALEVRTFKTINTISKKIINSYLEGRFEVLPRLAQNGNITEMVESKEAVFFVNSVKNIIGIVKNSGLTYDQVNIICSKTDYNEKRIKKLGKEFEIGRVPLEGEPRKMFTFCTRTVYLGADFYSDNARTFIISDANMTTLKVDISLDLPQILGRQRLDSNPWKNRAEFYYKTTQDFRKVPRAVFEKELDDKIKRTESFLRSFNRALDQDKFNIAESYEDRSRLMNYSKDYVGVNKHAGKTLVPEFNKLVLISEMRAFDIQQIDYKDRFTVFNTINKVLGNNAIIIDKRKISDIIWTINNELKSLPEKLRFYVENIEGLTNDEIKYIKTSILDPTMIKYVTTLTPEKIRACGYYLNDLNQKMEIELFDKDKVSNSILSEFNIGDKIPLNEIKSRLTELYKKINYTKLAKATDLMNYFNLKDCLLSVEVDGKKKRVHGYEILSVK